MTSISLANPLRTFPAPFNISLTNKCQDIVHSSASLKSLAHAVLLKMGWRKRSEVVVDEAFSVVIG